MPMTSYQWLHGSVVERLYRNRYKVMGSNPVGGKGKPHSGQTGPHCMPELIPDYFSGFFLWQLTA